jgi:hypothetical protein
MDPITALTQPLAIYPRSAVLSRPCPIPATAGIYGWYFKEIPGATSTLGCVTNDGLTLLYVGISPRGPGSGANLRRRIGYHHRGNAEGSTLRLTLGILLAEKSGFPLRRVGSGSRMTFTHIGEQWLDEWMNRNAYVTWVEHPEPWAIESTILSTLSLPLNIQDNRHHPFASQLSDLRQKAKHEARYGPIAREDNQRRKA